MLIDNATKADKVAALQAQKDEVARRYVSSVTSRDELLLTSCLCTVWPTSKRLDFVFINNSQLSLSLYPDSETLLYLLPLIVVTALYLYLSTRCAHRL